MIQAKDDKSLGDNKKGQVGIFATIIAILSSLMVMGAVVTNSTNKSFNNFDELNITIPVNLTVNETPTLSINQTSQNQIIENATLSNQNFINGTIDLITSTQNLTIPNQSISNETINLTIPIENITTPNQSIITNETVNLTSNITINNQTDTIIPNQSINLSEALFNLSNITILNYSAIVTENLSINLSNNATRLAKVFNEGNLDFDRNIRLKYLEKNNNFSNVLFANITGKTDFKLKVGAKQDKIRGISINNSNFVIDLLYCELNGRYCAFRVNGIPAAKLHSLEEFGTIKQTSFDLDGNYVLKVNSIKFNYCEGTGFCHFGYQSYDVVDVSIERK